MDIKIKTNPDTNLVTGRNGCHKLAWLHLWTASDDMLFIDGIGRSGKTLNAGFTLDPEAAWRFLTTIRDNVGPDGVFKE